MFEKSFPQSVRPKCRIMEEVVGRFLLQNPDGKSRIMAESVRDGSYWSVKNARSVFFTPGKKVDSKYLSGGNRYGNDKQNHNASKY